MRRFHRLGRLLGATLAGITATGAGVLGAASPAAATTQASSVNVTVMSPGQDQGTIGGFQQCGTSNKNWTPGYYAFPSKNSPVDNGLQTDIGNDQGMMKVTFSLPAAVNSGVVNLSAPNPPRPSGVPLSAPWGTVFPPAVEVHSGAAALYNCTVPAGDTFSSYYYAVQISYTNSSDTITYTEDQLPNTVSQTSTAPNQVGIPFSFPSGAASASMTVYVAGVVNPTEGTYNGVQYTVSVQGSTQVPAPASDSVSFVNTTPDPYASQLTSSLTSANPYLTATNVPSDGAVLTATIYDAFYNPVAGQSVYIGVESGQGAETSPIGATSGGTGEPQTGSNGEAQYYAYGTTASSTPDLFFAQDTSAGMFLYEPPPPSTTLKTVAITIVAADPSPPSVQGSGSSVSVTGGTYVNQQETAVTANGSTTATVTITLQDQFGNPVTNQAIVLQPIQPSPPALSEDLKGVVISPGDPPTPGSLCDQGPSSQIPGVSCTNSNGTTTFTVSDTRAQVVAFQITDLTDGFTMPTLYSGDNVNIPVVQFLPGPTSAATSSVSVDFGQSATVLANGSAQATVQVTLLDAEGNPEVGKAVTLAGSPGTASVITPVITPSQTQVLKAESCTAPAPGTTDCNGNAYFTVQDANVETVTYTATDTTDGLTLTGANQQPVVSFVTGAVSATNSTVSASPPTVVGDGQGVSAVTVHVEDGGQHPLAGEPVTLDTSSWPSVTVVPLSTTTQANGDITFDVRSSSPIGTIDIPVSVAGTPLVADAQVTFTNPPDLSNTTVSAGPANPEATGSGDETVSVTVKDSSGNPIPGLSLGLVAQGSSLPPSPSNPTTDASGSASFTVGSTTPGTVTYSVVDLSDNDRTLGTVTVDYIPVPDEAHESTVTASPHAVYTYVAGGSSQTSTVTVTLKDASGSPIQNDTVSLVASSQSAVVSPVAGGVSDASGVATFTVTDPNPETVTFTATDQTTGVQIAQQASVAFVLRPNENTTSTISASPTTVEADGTSSSTVTVTLENNGSPVAGDTVSLSQGSGHSMITTADPVSDAAGVVKFTVTDLTPETVAYQATDLTTATELTHDTTVTFTAPPGGSLQPAVSSISPTSGPGTGGTQVTILGSNFAGATAVRFGTQLAPTFTVSTSGSEIVATSPIPVAAGAVDVTVTGPGGTSPTLSADIFTYTSAPRLAVASVSPTSGPVGGGTAVTITGSDLGAVSAVTFGTKSANFAVNANGTSLTALAPPSLGAEWVNVLVSGAIGSSTQNAMDVFTYVGNHAVPPAISSVGPSSGPVRGGTLVTVSGTNLFGTTRVDFGSLAGSHVTVNASGTSLTVLSPPRATTGAVRVSVVTAAGESAAVSGDRFTYVADPLAYHRLARIGRVLDTAVSGLLRPRTTRVLAIAAHHGVPRDAVAVELKLTVTAGRYPSAVTLYPTGHARPARATLYARAHRTLTRTLRCALGRLGRVSLYDKRGWTKATAYVVGYYVVAPATTALQAAVAVPLVRGLSDWLLAPLEGFSAVPPTMTARFIVKGAAGQ